MYLHGVGLGEIAFDSSKLYGDSGHVVTGENLTTVLPTFTITPEMQARIDAYNAEQQQSTGSAQTTQTAAPVEQSAPVLQTSAPVYSASVPVQTVTYIPAVNTEGRAAPTPTERAAAKAAQVTPKNVVETAKQVATPERIEGLAKRVITSLILAKISGVL